MLQMRTKRVRLGLFCAACFWGLVFAGCALGSSYYFTVSINGAAAQTYRESAGYAMSGEYTGSVTRITLPMNAGSGSDLFGFYFAGSSTGTYDVTSSVANYSGSAYLDVDSDRGTVTITEYGTAITGTYLIYLYELTSGSGPSSLTLQGEFSVKQL